MIDLKSKKRNGFHAKRIHLEFEFPYRESVLSDTYTQRAPPSNSVLLYRAYVYIFPSSLFDTFLL